jgi:PIN domain nuclease of toxin-antitoxin system
MAKPVLLDTRAAIWLVNGDPMSDASRAAIEGARRHHAGVYVSPISAWEVATLAAKSKLFLSLEPEAWFAELLRKRGVRLADMPPRVLIRSASLPGRPPKDPADRIIAATSREYGSPVVTRDGELIPYARAGHIEAVAC